MFFYIKIIKFKNKNNLYTNKSFTINNKLSNLEKLNYMLKSINGANSASEFFYFFLFFFQLNLFNELINIYKMYYKIKNQNKTIS